ncbi:MAG: TonB-dependent receptor [Pseudomonadota bacterium]
MLAYRKDLMGIGVQKSGPIWAAAMALAVPLSAVCAPAEVAAQSQREINVPAGRLSSAIRQLARQAGISVAGTGSGLRQVRSRAVRGRYTPSEALRRLLAGTGYRAVAIGRNAYRIERAPRQSQPRRNQPNRASPAPSQTPTPRPAPARPTPPPPPPPPIIVEGTKRAFGPGDYPGGITILDINADRLITGSTSLDDALATIPSVNGTSLGSGRNKVFLRGIADSSFNGPSQSTIGLYLGEQRLTYSAPNPDLRMVDVAAVELLEGPQGTLYGAGTLAGLLRVNPNAPDPSAIDAASWGAASVTAGGGLGWDAGALLNLPVSDGAALRVVGYGGEDAGYIDDPRRGLADINSGSHYGGRAAFSVDIGPDWSVEASGFGQETRLDDGQYIDARLADLTRTDRLAQPFLGRIYGGALTVRGYLGDSELTSVTGLVDHRLSTRFDSSVLVGPNARQAFDETRDIRLITHETRLSGGDPERLNWLVGLGAMRNREDFRQLVTNLSGDNPPPFAQLNFEQDEIAVFGEASYRFAPQWSVTGGARLLYTRSSSERSFGQNEVVEPREGPARLLPALALSYRPREGLIAYARYQEGFRTGGVAIEREPNGDPVTARFDPDQVRSYELGLRGTIDEAAPLDFALTLHHSTWRDIQADLIDGRGFPITRNIGDGSVTGFDGSMTLRAGDGWTFDLAASLNDTGVDRIGPEGGIIRTSIPNVPDYAATLRGSKVWTLGASQEAGLALSGRYMGRSFLDLDQQSRAEQGGFASLDAAAWWQSDAIELRLEAINLTDTRGNRFAFGNPFTARIEDQETPLRPLTVRFQVTVKR